MLQLTRSYRALKSSVFKTFHTLFLVRESYRKELNLFYQVILTFCACLSVVNLIPLTLLSPDNPSHLLARYIDNSFCALFFLDFLMNLIKTPHKRHYLRTQGWLDLLSSVPLVGVLRLARIVRIFVLFRSLRDLKHLIHKLFKNATVSVPIILCLSVIMLILFGSTMILHFESHGSGDIKTPVDAIWWAIVTISTVGYGDMVPTTTSGRVLGILFMIYGVAFYGGISGFFASFLVNLEEEERELQLEQELGQVKNTLASLEEKLDKLLTQNGTPPNTTNTESTRS